MKIHLLDSLTTPNIIIDKSLRDYSLHNSLLKLLRRNHFSKIVVVSRDSCISRCKYNDELSSLRRLGYSDGTK